MKHLVSLFLAILPLGNGSAAPPDDKEWVVATRETPPFAFKDEKQNWQGISIELWQQTAAKLGIRYRYEEATIDEMLTGLNQGKYDAAVAALTITARREEQADFTHSFHHAGLGIAVLPRDTGWGSPFDRIFSWALLKLIGFILGMLVIASVLIYAFERRHNPDAFGGSIWSGMAASLWWSAVTMTTVGYGDKVPRTTGGRVVAGVWMFVSIIAISLFTAGVASTLTVNQLASHVEGPEDLPAVTVGTISATTSADYLRRREIPNRHYDQVDAGLQALLDGKIDALVYDLPILQYQVSRHYADSVHLLPRNFERQDYAFALPARSPWREQINCTMLYTIQAPAWQRTLDRYLAAP